MWPCFSPFYLLYFCILHLNCKCVQVTMTLVSKRNELNKSRGFIVTFFHTVLDGWWDIVSIAALIIIWGYLAFSLVWTMYYGEEIIVYSYFMISLLLINHYLLLKSCGREVIIKGVCFFELSKPSTQAKWHLKKLGEDKWLGHKLIGIFTYSFLVLIRIIFGSLYMSAIVFSNFYDIMDKLVAAYFYIFGIVAFHNIVPLCKELLDSEEVLVQLKPIESKLKKL